MKRAWRVLGVIGGVVGATVTFAASAAAAVVLHLDVPATRRLVAVQVSNVLHDTFEGEVTIENIGGLGLGGVKGVKARIVDPDGMRVLFVDGVSVKVRGLAAAKSALFGKGPIEVDVDDVGIDYVDVALDTDAQGNLRIANSFAAKKPSPPKDPNEPPGRGVRVRVPRVVLGHAWAHGAPPGAPTLDAELDDLLAKATINPNDVDADLAHVTLTGRNLPNQANPHGVVEAHFAMPFDDTDKMAVRARYGGTIGEIPAEASAEMDGKRVAARVDVRGVTHARLEPMVGDVPVNDTLNLHAEAKGVLPLVDATAHATLGAGTADAKASIETGTTTNIDATLKVRRIDLRSLVASAPASELGLDAKARAAIGPQGRISAKADVETLPGRIGPDRIPGVAIVAAYDGSRASASARLLDDDMPTVAEAVMENDAVDARVSSAVMDLAKLPRTNRAVTGNATLNAEAHVDLKSKAVDGRVLVRANALGFQTNSAHDATVLATASGTLDRPVVEVGTHVAGIRAAGQSVDALDVRGIVTPPVGKAPLLVEQAHVDLVRDNRSVGVTATRVTVAGDRVVVDGGVVQGFGEPIFAGIERDDKNLHVQLNAPRLDLATIGALADAKALKKGTVAVRADLDLRGDDARGDVRIVASDVAAGELHGAGGTIDARVAGRDVELKVDAALAEAGHVAIVTKRVAIGGSALDPRSWKRAKGRVDVDADVDLAKLCSLIPSEMLPVSELRGEAVLRTVVSRRSPDARPQVDLTAYTRGLVVAGKAPPEPPHDGKRVEPVPPWRLDDVDVHLDASVDAFSGHTELALLAYDEKGRLASLDAKSELPLDEILAAPASARDVVLGAPLNARLSVPPRPLAEMPRAMGLGGFKGIVDADLTVSGTPIDPRIDFVAHGRGVRSPTLPVRLATSSEVKLAYDGKEATLDAKVHDGDKPLVDLSSKLAVRVRDLVEKKDGIPWDASTRVTLTDFPLQTVAALQDRRVRGAVSGTVALEGLHRDAKLTGELAFDKLKIGRARYETAKVTVAAKDGTLAARARFDQTDGFADARVDMGLAWGADLVPTSDEKRPLVARLEAKGFRAAAASPFVQSAVNQVDGRIDADATIELGPQTKMQGRVVLREGTIDVVALGQELRDVQATVDLSPDGTIKVHDVFARGIEGQLRAGAEVRTKGLALVSAKANLEIPREAPFDLSLQGQPLGDVYGEARLTASAENGALSKVVVEVPKFNVKLPQVMKTGLQELEPKENVRVGVMRDGTFARLPLDREDLKPKVAKEDAKPAKSPLSIDVKLGDITVVRGNQARAVLGGGLHVEQAAESKVTGQIAVKEGTLELQGKEFTIEKGTVTFQPDDPSNPIVVATATWTAADDTKVYADFVGPVKTGKVNLRSEPARPKNEILALVLFGTADGMNGAPPPPGRAPNGTTKAATAVGGGFAAEGLTSALDDLAGIQAQARIDTTESNNPRPELEVQVAQSVSVAFAHVLGNPPITEPDRNLARVDWRFEKNWSLETTVGDRGKAEVDAVWKKRY